MSSPRSSTTAFSWLSRTVSLSRGFSASGSTRLAEGAYLRDFEKFVAVWHQELEHLSAHRSKRSR